MDGRGGRGRWGAVHSKQGQKKEWRLLAPVNNPLLRLAFLHFAKLKWRARKKRLRQEWRWSQEELKLLFVFKPGPDIKLCDQPEGGGANDLGFKLCLEFVTTQNFFSFWSKARMQFSRGWGLGAFSTQKFPNDPLQGPKVEAVLWPSLKQG